jgi:hypothetical protein
MKVSTARYALPTVLKELEPLRDLLGALPAVFPTEDDHRIRPLAIGIDKPLVAMAVARGTDADHAATVVRQVLRRYCRSGAYMSALNQPDALRHALDGTPIEPVAEAHKIARRPKPPAAHLIAQRLESFVMSVAVKAIKVTVVLDPRVLRPAPAGADVVLDVTTEGGLAARARLNPKSYRKALDAVREQGPDNVAVILQGRMVTPGEIIDAGISAMPKKA